MKTELYIEQLQMLLEQVISETTSTAQQLAQQTSHILSRRMIDPGRGIKLSTEERQALQYEIKASLGKSTYTHGIGFAGYTPENQEEKDYWTLEWWFKKGDELQQAKLENYQNAQRFLDFRSFDWFQQPACSKQPYIQGPYVDYICNGAYTITTAYPVMVQSQFVGVIAIDLLVSSLEKVFLPGLRKIKQAAVIINDTARVITSNTKGFRTGTLVRHTPMGSTIVRSSQPLQLLVL